MSEFSKNYNKGLGLTLGALSAIGVYSIIDAASSLLKNWAVSKINANAQKEDSSESKVDTED